MRRKMKRKVKTFNGEAESLAIKKLVLTKNEQSARLLNPSKKVRQISRLKASLEAMK